MNPSSNNIQRQLPGSVKQNRHTLTQIDSQFESIGCLGYGSFGSVFLARKRSGRKVALKVVSLENDIDNEQYEIFRRELHAVWKLNSADQNENRDLSIIYFEDWFVGENFACIVMIYVDGGTLAEEIVSRQEPFEERRIAWYALQLSEALAYAHGRGVAHHDVKSSNVLIGRGGKLLLADFGSAIGPGEESVGMTEIYAAPELLKAHAEDDYSTIEPEKIDAYGLGCILYELLCNQKLIELSGDKTLAEYVVCNGAEAAMNLPCIQLPWLNEQESTQKGLVGYSIAIRFLVKNLLEPDTSSRWIPAQLQKPLRIDPKSPLITSHVAAAQPLVPGAAVTVGNIQLGMFVQRGCDWNDGDIDGGIGSIGVVVSLDADAGYTKVAWPRSNTLEPVCCRIGASDIYELQVGPTPLPDFYAGTQNEMKTGIVRDINLMSIKIGQQINNNCIVVGLNEQEKCMFVAPMLPIPVPSIAPLRTSAKPVKEHCPRKPMAAPETWDKVVHNRLIPITFFGNEENEEKADVLQLFYSLNSGMDIQNSEILSIERVQSNRLWNAYANNREDVAAENWGIANERRLFCGINNQLRDTLAQNPDIFFECCYRNDADSCPGSIGFFERPACANRACKYRNPDGSKLLMISRVALGRVKNFEKQQQPIPWVSVNFHSEKRRNLFSVSKEIFTIPSLTQAYPEYIIRFKDISSPSRRIVVARRPADGRPNSQRVAPRVEPSFSFAGSGTAHAQQSGSIAAPTDLKPKTAVVANANGINPSNQNPSASTNEPVKMCVVCLQNPVCRLLLPCGHPSLCQLCSTEQGLQKMRRKCPECRTKIKNVVKFYGKVLNN